MSVNQGRYVESCWTVIDDPSGEFIGKQFTTKDIQYTAELHYWPEGITWQNNMRKQIATYVNRTLKFSERTPKNGKYSS